MDNTVQVSNIYEFTIEILKQFPSILRENNNLYTFNTTDNSCSIINDTGEVVLEIFDNKIKIRDIIEETYIKVLIEHKKNNLLPLTENLNFSDEVLELLIPEISYLNTLDKYKYFSYFNDEEDAFQALLLSKDVLPFECTKYINEIKSISGYDY